jgi:2-iminobutanoate/2-iminopropanoate deaminase
MEREIVRVEPIESNFEKWGAPVPTCTRAGNTVFVSGMTPYRPRRQGNPPERALRTPGRAHPPPARIFFCMPKWTGPFDVEVDCIAVTKD